VLTRAGTGRRSRSGRRTEAPAAPDVEVAEKE
jgi:hypothetical protein